MLHSDGVGSIQKVVASVPAIHQLRVLDRYLVAALENRPSHNDWLSSGCCRGRLDRLFRLLFLARLLHLLKIASARVNTICVHNLRVSLVGRQGRLVMSGCFLLA